MMYIASQSTIVQHDMDELTKFIANRDKIKPPLSVKGRFSFPNRKWYPKQLALNEDQTMLFSLSDKFSHVQQWDLMVKYLLFILMNRV